MRTQSRVGVVFVAAALGSCAIPAIDSGAAGDCVCNCNNACGGEQTFEYLVNGVLSYQSRTMTDVDVSKYREVVVYVEQATSDCANGNNNTWVDVVFKVDTESPAGETGQGFNFSGSSGGRFRVDGVAMQLVPRCSGDYSFNYTIAGVACAGAN